MQEPTVNWEGSSDKCRVSLSSHPALLGCVPHIRGWLESAWRLGALFAREGFKDVRVASPEAKPDDFVLAGGDLAAVLREARKAYGNGDRTYWTSRTNLWPELRA